MLEIAPETETMEGDEKCEQLVDLVVRAQNGDQETIGKLYLQYQQTIYQKAYAMLKCEHKAQDMVQDIFLHVMQSISQLKEPERFAGWLKTITTHMCINKMNRGNNIIPSEYVNVWKHYYLDRKESTVLAAIIKERRKLVLDTINGLTRRDREILIDFYFRGLKINELSLKYKAPVGTIKGRLRGARKRLINSLNQLFEGRDPETELF